MSKGILFSQPMYAAVVSGTKTMTRRLIKPQPKYKYFVDFIADYGIIAHHGDTPDERQRLKPRYLPGEVVYLKEPYCPTFVDEESDEIKKILYKYDGIYYEIEKYRLWCNKMFMPEKYARHFIEITSVKAERLQNISDSDCEAEGIVPEWQNGFVIGWRNKTDGITYEKRQQAFAALWDIIHKKDKWDTNPWIWRYELSLKK